MYVILYILHTHTHTHTFFYYAKGLRKNDNNKRDRKIGKHKLNDKGALNIKF